jgi:NitT/TauT family transport system permease protein
MREGTRGGEPLWRRIAAPAAVGLAAIMLWEWGPKIFAVPPTLIPPASRVVLSAVEKSELVAVHAWPTLYETLLGFVLSVVGGIVAGWAIAKIPLLHDTVYPLLGVLQVLPKEALAPLLMLWLGAGTLSRLTLAFLIAFFPMVINTVLGLRSLQPEMSRLAQSLSCSRWQLFVKIEVPWSLTYLFAGMKISITLSVIGVTVAEIVAGRSGLGYLLLFASSRMDTAFSLAILLVLVVLGVALFGLIALAERRLIYWRP